MRRAHTAGQGTTAGGVPAPAGAGRRTTKVPGVAPGQIARAAGLDRPGGWHENIGGGTGSGVTGRAPKGIVHFKSEGYLMAIQSIDISDVLVFQRRGEGGDGNATATPQKIADGFDGAFHLDFCDGINVIIGENGVGKTSLLKMIYAATQWANRQTLPESMRRFLQFFSAHLKDNDALKSSEHEGYCAFRVSMGEQTFCVQHFSEFRHLFRWMERSEHRVRIYSDDGNAFARQRVSGHESEIQHAL